MSGIPVHCDYSPRTAINTQNTGMKRNKRIQITLGLALIAVIIGLGVVYYLFNLPHQDVQGTATAYTLTVDELVDEYLRDPDAADQKYLDEQGFSRVIEVSGRISSQTQNYAGQSVIVISAEVAPVGLRCTMIDAYAAYQLPSDGSIVALKGVIRSGAWSDQELGIFEPVIMDQCAPVR